jgi:hypothetical protein
MTILLVGTCVDGMVRHNARGINADGRRQWGITGPTPREKCGGKGCAKTDAIEAEPDAS